jgi:hypothetical protein
MLIGQSRRNSLLKTVSLSLTFAFAIFMFPELSFAKATLLTLADGIIVYSGPGTYYRPLAVLGDKMELKAATKTVSGKGGTFYKVLVKLSEKKSAIGYIPTAAPVKLNTAPVDEEEIEKFGGVALINRALQLSYSRFANQETSWHVGYLRYLSPGFYIKGFGGQYQSFTVSSVIAGGEIGNDALLFGNFSGLVSYAAGFFLPTSKDDVFLGSKTINLMAQAAVGLRYNINGVASLSAAGTQIVLFNANNSHVTYGLNMTLEVGL